MNDGSSEGPTALLDPVCVRCQTTMIRRVGHYGEFWACPKSTVSSPHPARALRKKRRLFGPEDEYHWDTNGDWGAYDDGQS